MWWGKAELTLGAHVQLGGEWSPNHQTSAGIHHTQRKDNENEVLPSISTQQRSWHEASERCLCCTVGHCCEKQPTSNYYYLYIIIIFTVTQCRTVRVIVDFLASAAAYNWSVTMIWRYVVIINMQVRKQKQMVCLITMKKKNQQNFQNFQEELNCVKEEVSYEFFNY